MNTLSWAQVVCAAAGLLIVLNAGLWFFIARNSNDPYFGGLFEGIGCVIITLILVVIAMGLLLWLK